MNDGKMYAKRIYCVHFHIETGFLCVSGNKILAIKQFPLSSYQKRQPNMRRKQEIYSSWWQNHAQLLRKMLLLATAAGDAAADCCCSWHFFAEEQKMSHFVHSLPKNERGKKKIRPEFCIVLDKSDIIYLESEILFLFSSEGKEKQKWKKANKCCA